MSEKIITVFRNHLRPDALAAYAELAPEMLALARSMPGFIDAKTFTADDGERVTVVTFTDVATHNGWRDHPEHRVAQQRGVHEFYADYSIQVATVAYEHRFHHRP